MPPKTIDMKKMTRNDFMELSHGDRVTKIKDGKIRRLFFVGMMPGSASYYIFCDGTHFESAYVPPYHMGEMKNWYKGDFKSAEVGEILIRYHEDQIKGIKEIY